MKKEQESNNPTSDAEQATHPIGTALSLALVLGSSVIAAIVTSLFSPILVAKLKQSPTIIVRAEPKAIIKGESVTITWESRRATEVMLKPLNVFAEPSGSLSVSPNETTTYTVVGKSWLGEDTSSSDIVVVHDQAVIASDNTSTSTPPATVTINGEISYLEWGCEETRRVRQQYTLTPSEEFVSADWILLGVENAKGYTLPPPQFSQETRIVVGEASFRGLDRVFFACTAGGNARIQMRVVVKRQ